ncbi:hypothetical protein BT93_C0836 [Corymbia citriodora subsp. variegata]|nr:hypothetical protein BT93_C0836 [Corymbia citriodora subsp. variegata]
MEYVDKNSHTILFVGIHGMGGIGKTTLAKTIYNKLSNQFEHRSFIADVRESWKRNGIRYLQNQLLDGILKQENLAHGEDEGINFLSSRLKDKKVLIVLDDMDDDDQLKALAGNRNWFSSGSVIFITTRNESILDKAHVDYKHEHEKLDKDTSLILFSRHAFRRDTPPSEFKKLTDEVLSTTGGLPLSLEVLGSLFCGKKEIEWVGKLEKLKEIPDKKVQEKLKISYEALESGQKEIFLDVACFFIGTDWRIASYMWDACGFYPKEGIEVLRFMSLIKIGEYHKLKMHDQLRDLGRLIVHEGKENMPQNCSRIWDSNKALEILEENEFLLSLFQPFWWVLLDLDLAHECFKAFRATAALPVAGESLCGLTSQGQFGVIYLNPVYCYLVLKRSYITREKRVNKLISRTYQPLDQSVQGTKKIQAINLSKGNSEGSGKTIDQGDNILKGKQFKKLKNLRFLDARGAQFTGDFKGSMKKLKWLHWEYYPSPFEGNNLYVKQLRVLKLWGKISDKWQGWSFIKMAKDLKYLNLAHCRSLKRTSFLTAFENLEVLILKGCEKLKQIDSSIGNMRSLVCLDLTECDRLKELPAEVGELRALKQLLLGWTFISLPDSIWALRNLEILDIGCAKIENLPESVGALQNLIILDINHTKIKKLPHGIGRLRKLRDLCAEYCNELEEEIPEGIYNLSSLQRLTLSFCYKLLLPWALPSSLKYLRITCQNRRLPSLSNLTHLKELVLLDCEFLECIWEHPSTLSEKSVNTPFELEILEICRCKLVKTLDVSQFNHLRKLCFKDCNSVHEIRGLNKLKYLESLEITACAIEMFDLSESKGLRLFEAKNCKNLVEIQGLDKLQYLEGIVIAGCTSIVRLDLRNSKDLRKSKATRIIDAKNCENLVEIQGLDRLESLEEIDFSGCSSIARPSLPKSKDLKIFGAKYCENLDKNQALYRLESSTMPDYGALPNRCCFDLAINCCDNLHDIQSLETCCTNLWIEDCKSLAKFPNSSNFDNLWILCLSNCHELREIQGLEKSTSLEHIAIIGCCSISSCTNLESLVVQNCEKLMMLQGL